MHRRPLLRRDFPKVMEKLPKKAAVSRSARPDRSVRSSAHVMGEKRNSRGSGSK